MTPINKAAYDDGLAAYRAGETIAFLIGRSEVREREHPDEDESEMAGSLLCGFFDGFLEDFRRIPKT